MYQAFLVILRSSPSKRQGELRPRRRAELSIRKARTIRVLLCSTDCDSSPNLTKESLRDSCSLAQIEMNLSIEHTARLDAKERPCIERTLHALIAKARVSAGVVDFDYHCLPNRHAVALIIVIARSQGPAGSARRADAVNV